MTRAAIFFVSLLCATSALSMAAAQNATPAQSPPASASPQSSATPTKPSTTQTKPAPRSHHRRRVLPPNCGTAPTTASQTASNAAAPAAPAGANSAETSSSTAGTNPASSSGTPTTATTAASPAATPAPSNCPPSKVIVRQGGTSDPSLQLAGGAAGSQTANQRDSANQMLGTTETNLKKIAGRELTANQQDMVNQIRQFMDQSKAAVDAGDLDRARTLAWKAQLLSEDLIKPEK